MGQRESGYHSVYEPVMFTSVAATFGVLPNTTILFKTSTQLKQSATK